MSYPVFLRFPSSKPAEMLFISPGSLCDSCCAQFEVRGLVFKPGSRPPKAHKTRTLSLSFIIRMLPTTTSGTNTIPSRRRPRCSLTTRPSHISLTNLVRLVPEWRYFGSGIGLSALTGDSNRIVVSLGWWRFQTNPQPLIVGSGVLLTRPTEKTPCS